jgi:hypothetical protein
MQGSQYSRFLIHGNLQQLCIGATLVIRLSLAQYTIRKFGMLFVTLVQVSTSCPRLCFQDWDTCSFSNLEDSSTCWCIDLTFRGDSGELTSICPGVLHLCGFHGPWYVGWCRNATHSWEAIPKWRKGEYQCGKWNHPLPHWEEELDFLISTNRRAMLFVQGNDE